jgi:pimeloyl-ACP methyl ester carboxylesterase
MVQSTDPAVSASSEREVAEAVSTLRLRGASGVSLAADRYGPPDRPTVLFLHGAGQTRHSWRRTALKVGSAGYTAVCVDHRGHGDSDWSVDADYEIGAFAADLQEVLDQLADRPVVVGASLGGLAALTALVNSHRPLFRAIVLVDIAPRIDFAGASRILGFMAERPDGFDSLDEAARIISSYTGRDPSGGDAQRLERVLRRDEAGKWRWHWDVRFLHGKFGDAIEERAELMHGQLLDAARRITVPTLIIRGEKSEIVDEEAVDELLQVVPGSKAIEVVGAGHMVAGDANDAFTEAVLRFLDSLPQ